MAEYISKEEVINITAETGAWETQNRVRELPAADVQPVRYGEWVSKYDDNHGFHYVCSNCGTISGTKLKFCFDCGADMRGEDSV